MIADEPIRPMRIGFSPATSAGNMNLTRMNAANPSPTSEANPRQRATATTTRAKASGQQDQRGAALEVGELELRRLAVDRRDADQLDLLAHLDPGGVQRVGQRDGGREALVVALEQLRR